MKKTRGAARDLPVLTDELRAAPVRHATRVIARRLVDLVEAQRDRLTNGKSDALHDFRAALRRLRTWVRACRPSLGDTVRGSSRRALAALVHSHEVSLAESLRAVHSAADVVAAHGRRVRRGRAPLAARWRVARSDNSFSLGLPNR